MIQRLLNEFGTMGRDDSHPDRAALPDLAARLHKLKGCAGTLGATALARAASLADVACRAQRVEQLDAPLQEVALQMHRLSQAATPMLQAQDSSESDEDASAAVDVSPQAAGELMAMLRRCDLDAVEAFAALAPGLRRMLGSDVFAQLRQQVDNLDFEAASQTMQAFPVAPATAESVA
jgi:HPt (histidine-containing phosphotransfer) domain-containing protein